MFGIDLALCVVQDLSRVQREARVRGFRKFRRKSLKMLIIRADQMRQMDSLMQEEYHRKVIAFLGRIAPELTGGYEEGDLLKRVAAASGKARSLGLSSAEGVMGFIGLSLAAGLEIDQDTKVHRFLASSESDVESKVRWLFLKVVALLKQGNDRDDRA